MEKGDFVKIDFVAYRKSDGKVIDTTYESIAKESQIYSQEVKYKPLLIVLGRGEVIKGLEEAILEMKEGEEKEFDVPPEKAFGKRDPDNIQIISRIDFEKQNIEPVEGNVVEVNGKKGIIKSVNSGRVLVDFNHALAGESLHYKVKVVSVIKDEIEKIKAVMERYDLDGSIEKDKGKVKVLFPKEVNKFSMDFIQSKAYFLFDFFSLFPDLEIQVVEDYARPSGGS